MPRFTRLLAGLAGLAALSAGLTGCDKPLPKVSVYGDGTTVTISPTSYCFDAQHCRRGGLDLPRMSVAPDEKLLIDVPRALDKGGWRVRALSLDGKTSYGSSGTITGRHTYRVVSTAAEGKPFIVEVNALLGGKPVGGTWSLLVTVAQAGS